MPRTKLIRTNLHPYHITVRSNNKVKFPGSLKDVWDVFQFHLHCVSVIYGFQIHAFTLMSNHMHLLLFTPDMNLDAGMQYLLRETSKQINTLGNQENHIFGGNYKWSLINDHSYYLNCMKYIFQNPLRANLARHIEGYPYTSMAGQLGITPLKFPVFNTLIPNQENVNWLNALPEIPDDQMRAAMNRPIFKFKVDRINRKI